LSAVVAAQQRVLAEAVSRSSPGTRHCVAGRILAVSADQPTRQILADPSGRLAVEIPDAALCGRGDLVALEGTYSEGRLLAEQVQILAQYRASRPFPSPGGEYHRLHCTVPARAEVLAQRARALAAIRSFFDERGFIEVQTPHRVRRPGLEPHLVPLESGDCYLITSPEYHMKRLLSGGLERIYFLGPCWRGDEIGSHHLQEFCMLEWYQALSGMEELMAQTAALVAHVARAVTGQTCVRFDGRDVELHPPFERLTVAEAFACHAGVSISGVTDAGELRRRAEAAGHGPFAEDEPFEGIASRLLVECVEPALVGPRPVLLYDFPPPMAALARLRPDDPTVAERFELYAGGLELANAFVELTDPDEQLRRLEEDRAARRAAGRPAFSIDERFISALREGMPPAAGIALGVDRMVMLVTGIEDISQVVAFAPEEI
jgi:lysyl-tRNA synthetase class 2